LVKPTEDMNDWSKDRQSKRTNGRRVVTTALPKGGGRARDSKVDRKYVE
jgi:hypothetical protein